VNATEARSAIAVASDRSLVADAVGAALSGSNLVIERIPWPGDRRKRDAGWSPGAGPPDLGLMLCDLGPPAIGAAFWVLGRYPTRWLLLTDAARGPLWGAMFEAGVVRILPSSTSMADLLAIIGQLRGEGGDDGLAERDKLMEEWRQDQFDQADARARISSLTRREFEVLRLLHLGFTVREIADKNGVAQSTVRSQVRSVLRKLGVNSQLAAAAQFEKWDTLQ
jgi:two-component system nitrate/nitrite response regulator NarL